MPVASDELKRVMRRFVSGVTVVTAQRDGQVWGMTATAFCSVSLQPPLILICVGHESRCHRQIIGSGAFGVHLLRADQQDLAEGFTSKDDEERLAYLSTLPRSPHTGVPIFEDCLAWLDCTVSAAHAAGDHTIFIGLVEASGLGPDHPSLAYLDRHYLAVDPHDSGTV